MKSEEIKKLCEEKHIRMVDFKMTDIDGRWRHITIPVERFGENVFTQGIGFTDRIMDMHQSKKVTWYFCQIQIQPMWILLQTFLL